MGVNRMSHDSKETTDRAIWSLHAMAGRLQGSLLMGGCTPPSEQLRVGESKRGGREACGLWS